MILLLTVFSQVILIQIFFMRSWPTYLPHFVTAITFVFIAFQYFKYGANIEAPKNL